MMEIHEKDGYLVDENDEKVIFYECDHEKNTECDKSMCSKLIAVDEHSNFGCSKTTDPKFRKLGGKAWYAVLKEETYWGREYINV